MRIEGDVCKKKSSVPEITSTLKRGGMARKRRSGGEADMGASEGAWKRVAGKKARNNSQ